jgi:hypothetical protein
VLEDLAEHDLRWKLAQRCFLHPTLVTRQDRVDVPPESLFDGAFPPYRVFIEEDPEWCHVKRQGGAFLREQDDWFLHGEQNITRNQPAKYQKADGRNWFAH